LPYTITSVSPRRQAASQGNAGALDIDRSLQLGEHLLDQPGHREVEEENPQSWLYTAGKGRSCAMPMTDEHRRAYLQRAGVTQEQIDETVGELPIHEPTLQELGVARDDAELARGAIRQVRADAALISAKYSAVAQARERGAAAVDPDELETDRKILHELYADEYTLLNGSGDVVTKAQVIDAMLKGTIRFDGWGRAGFEAVSQSLRVYGDTAVVTGDWRLGARGRAINTETGEVYWQDLRGLRRITSIYGLRANRWKGVHSQMTRVAADRNWRLALVEAV
jgi:ketosteroid isomerase-like protein